MLRGEERDYVQQARDVVHLEGEVYAAVDSEREYQEYVVDPALAEDPSSQHSIPAELVLMKVYVDKAMNTWASKPGSETTLDFVRKIAGIAVRCMENHGAPPRMVPREVKDP